MSQPVPGASEQDFMHRTLEAAIRIGLVAILVGWCFTIVRPFVTPILWGMIIAIAVYPSYLKLSVRIGDRPRAAAGVFAVLSLLTLIVPAVLLAGTLVESVQWLSGNIEQGTLRVPPPPESVASWPAIGERLYEFWNQASENLESAISRIEPQLRAIGAWLLSGAAGVGFSILQFVIAIVIAGIILLNGQGGGRIARSIGGRLAGEQGIQFAKLAENTVRSVARGVLGVALIQSVLAGIGFLAVGLPGAGLWALLTLLLCVIQLGPGLIVIPAIAYVFSTAGTVVAVLFLIWGIFVILLDNVLKPMLLGRGVPVPMAVIFLGAIGGFITSGIIGLFVGAVILVIGYTLFLAWLGETPIEDVAKES